MINLKKTDIQTYLKSYKKTTIIWDNVEFCIYPKYIIDACLKDFEKGDN